MLRLLACLVALGTGPAFAAPRLKPKPPEVASLAGTKWVGQTYEKHAMTVVFEAGGVMVYSYNGQTHRNATWTQDGDKVYFEANQKYCEFNGRLKGDRIEGEEHNVTGLRWETVLTRERDK